MSDLKNIPYQELLKKMAVLKQLNIPADKTVFVNLKEEIEYRRKQARKNNFNAVSKVLHDGDEVQEIWRKDFQEDYKKLKSSESQTFNYVKDIKKLSDRELNEEINAYKQFKIEIRNSRYQALRVEKHFREKKAEVLRKRKLKQAFQSVTAAPWAKKEKSVEDEFNIKSIIEEMTEKNEPQKTSLFENLKKNFFKQKKTQAGKTKSQTKPKTKKRKTRVIQHSSDKFKENLQPRTILIFSTLIALTLISILVFSPFGKAKATLPTIKNSEWQSITDIGRFKQNEKLSTLEKYAKDTREKMRIASLKSMKQLALWESMPRLIESLNDSSQWVRQEANKSIAAILGIDYHLHVGDQRQRMKNIEWIKEHYPSQKRNYDSWRQRQS